jgi:hypothetical protein
VGADRDLGRMTPAVVLVAIQLLTGPLGLAPCSVRLRIRVEPMKANRSVTVTLDSPDFYRRSVHELEGDHAAATQPEQEYRDLPSGTYEIRAVVTRPPQKAVHAVTTFVCS